MLEQGGEVERPPGFWATMTAPVYGVVRLPRAARLLTRARLWHLPVLMLLCVLVQVALCLFMALWEDTIRFGQTVGTTGGVWPSADTHVSRSLGDVWDEWKSQGTRNPAIKISIGVAVAAMAGVLVAIAFFWPRVHRHGRLLPTLRRTYAAVLASVGSAWVLTAVIYTVYIQVDHWRKRGGWSRIYGLREEHVAVIGILSSIVLMLFTLGRAVRAVSDGVFDPELPPQCEGCGYDLTHRPESGVCPECGLSVDKSLTPGLRRRPSDYDESPTLPDALITSVRVLFNSSAFHTGLTVRGGPMRDAAFRARHHAAMFCGAIVWMILLVGSTLNYWDWEDCVGILAASLAATIAGWALLHAVGSIVCLIWVVRWTLPDLRWGVRVLNYEAVYLWVFCLFNGSMITSFVMFDDWIGDALGRWNYATGLPTAMLAIMLPNLVLIGVWMVRLFRGGRAVQWANF